MELRGTCALELSLGTICASELCVEWRGLPHLELVVELGDPPGNDALEAGLEGVGAELEANLHADVDFTRQSLPML